MSSQDTTIVQVIRDQANSLKLFEQWNKTKSTNIQCSNTECIKNTEKNAYLVIKFTNKDKMFIVPLCKSCYENEINTTCNSTEKFIDLGSCISVKKSLLVEYVD